MEQPKPLVITKVPLEFFIETLKDILDQGYHYADIIGIPGSDLDQIGIMVYNDYKELGSSSESDEFSDEDINDLI